MIAIVGVIINFGFWIIGVINAYRGELYLFPIVGD